MIGKIVKISLILHSDCMSWQLLMIIAATRLRINPTNQTFSTSGIVDFIPAEKQRK